MNRVILSGRLTKDPEVRYTDAGMSIASFSLAADRKFKTNDGVTADFINCKAFKQTAEFIEKYFHRGDGIELEGRIQTGSYTNKDGVKVYTTDVMVDNVEFPKGKAAGEQAQTNRPDPGKAKNNEFMNIPDGVEDEGMPFN
ncbi:single-stranded DNA-binding protein [Parasporobacterium paucivorans]|uniref:Single-stranded DNA-binding protein n=1 Tax=Parasporobacterium paucivorans DSM 15970 TaxID=1122934 RepID=A0A1M6B6J6_9FIRM|nr:single-stranded DNA-binding protein [Parasporobacterium paucivorans]SHI44208.1 single-strand DNA-binding protein [Parasporobacterium paucivorans DSM 15970]